MRADPSLVLGHETISRASTIERRGAVTLQRVRRESTPGEGARPRRFRVGFVAYSERPVTYNVSTWLDELMAVALAANAHASSHPRSPINSLFVEELDPLPSGELSAIPKGEVVNPNEWR